MRPWKAGEGAGEDAGQQRRRRRARAIKVGESIDFCAREAAAVEDKVGQEIRHAERRVDGQRAVVEADGLRGEGHVGHGGVEARGRVVVVARLDEVQHLVELQAVGRGEVGGELVEEGPGEEGEEVVVVDGVEGGVEEEAGDEALEGVAGRQGVHEVQDAAAQGEGVGDARGVEGGGQLVDPGRDVAPDEEPEEELEEQVAEEEREVEEEGGVEEGVFGEGGRSERGFFERIESIKLNRTHDKKVEKKERGGEEERRKM